jgi:8-oxo-dGTP pyrophosphatase MutT (NUDIX family)
MKKIFNNWRVCLAENEKKDSDQVVKIVLLDPEGRLLVLKNENWGPDLPGGHILEDETPEAGLQREVEEETGLKIKDFSKLEYESKNKLFYKGTVSNKNISLSHEHDSYDFLSPEAALETDMREIFKMAVREATGK